MSFYATVTLWWLWTAPLQPVVTVQPGVTVGPCAARTDVAPLVLEWDPTTGFTFAAQVRANLEACDGEPK